MKLLACVVNREAIEQDELRTVNDVFAYNLLRYFPLWCDVQTAVIGKAGTEYPTADAAIVLMNNGLAKLKWRDIDLYADLKRSVTGPIGVFATDYGRGLEHGDHMFHCKPRPNRGHTMLSEPETYEDSSTGGVTFIGWAADSQRFWPNKYGGVRILVDHHRVPEDERAEPCLTQAVLDECLRLKRNTPGVTVRYVNDDVVTVEPGMDLELIEGRVSNREWAEELSLADVFCVTHWERPLGLAPLEAAMSGCLVVSPKDYVSRCLLDCFPHVEWTESIPWDDVAEMADPEECRRDALRFDRWPEIARTICKTLEEL